MPATSIPMVEKYHKRQALAEQQKAEAHARRVARARKERRRGTCFVCHVRPRRAPDQSACLECHVEMDLARRRQRTKERREAREAEAKRLRALARERKREKANPAYFDWAGAPDRTM